MIYGGQYFCRIRELKPIEFGMYEMVPTDTTTRRLERQTENGVQTQSS